MIGLTPLGWFPLGYYDTGTAPYSNIPAPFEEMDCPDSWDDQLIQYYTNLGINTLIPQAVPGKAKTWL